MPTRPLENIWILCIQTPILTHKWKHLIHWITSRLWILTRISCCMWDIIRNFNMACSTNKCSACDCGLEIETEILTERLRQCQVLNMIFFYRLMYCKMQTFLPSWWSSCHFSSTYSRGRNNLSLNNYRNHDYGRSMGTEQQFQESSASHESFFQLISIWTSDCLKFSLYGEEICPQNKLKIEQFRFASFTVCKTQLYTL